MDRNPGEPKVVIVTGASAGIGRETALAFARRGAAVVLAARRVDRLQEVAAECRKAGAEETLVAPTDVASREQVDAMAAAAVERFGRVDVLVNNAGYGLYAPVVDIDEQELRRLFDVNFYGLWYGMTAAARIMVKQGSGHIFNVSSVIGKRATPFHGGYCASKFAVNGLTEAARVELRPHNVWVTLVCPALTETEFFSKGSMARRPRRDLKFTKFHKPMPARPVAEAIARAAGRYKPEMVFTFGGRFLARLSALWPGGVDRMMSHYMRDLKDSIQSAPK